MAEDTDGTNRDNGVDYSSLGATRSIAKQFEGEDAQGYYDEESTDHIPYRYDDALKYRFPEQKKYVAAHNYIPVGGSSTAGHHEPETSATRAFQKFNNVQSSFNRGFNPATPRVSNWRGASESKGSFYNNIGGRGRGYVSNAVGGINRGRGTFSNNSNDPGSIYRKAADAMNDRDQATRQFVEASYKVPVYTYEDEQSLFNAIRDGTYDLATKASDGASISNTGAKPVGGFSLPDPGSTMYNYRRLHPLATAPVTGEKAYFNMNPRIYDYDDNTYHPITIDTDLMRSEAKRLHSMGLNNKDIA